MAFLKSRFASYQKPSLNTVVSNSKNKSVTDHLLQRAFEVASFRHCVLTETLPFRRGHCQIASSTRMLVILYGLYLYTPLTSSSFWLSALCHGDRVLQFTCKRQCIITIYFILEMSISCAKGLVKLSKITR